MSNQQAAPETKGVTAELLATVDLDPEIESMADAILQGTITDHRNGVATDYGRGVGWPEDRNTTHWLENHHIGHATGTVDLCLTTQGWMPWPA
jgi:hypothetical protein